MEAESLNCHVTDLGGFVTKLVTLFTHTGYAVAVVTQVVLLMQGKTAAAKPA